MHTKINFSGPVGARGKTREGNDYRSLSKCTAVELTQYLQGHPTRFDVGREMRCATNVAEPLESRHPPRDSLTGFDYKQHNENMQPCHKSTEKNPNRTETLQHHFNDRLIPPDAPSSTGENAPNHRRYLQEDANPNLRTVFPPMVPLFRYF
jgi:hypothetical protein